MPNKILTKAEQDKMREVFKSDDITSGEFESLLISHDALEKERDWYLKIIQDAPHPLSCPYPRGFFLGNNCNCFKSKALNNPSTGEE